MSLLSGDKFGDILSASPDDAILPRGICLEKNDLPAGKQILSFWRTATNGDGSYNEFPRYIFYNMKKAHQRRINVEFSYF